MEVLQRSRLWGKRRFANRIACPSKVYRLTIRDLSPGLPEPNEACYFPRMSTLSEIEAAVDQLSHTGTGDPARTSCPKNRCAPASNGGVTRSTRTLAAKARRAAEPRLYRQDGGTTPRDFGRHPR